ncbi:hypothetical protein [Mesorhizobium sp. M1405]|uniref:hypothetical protein n=1 Tax=unclassified Mesorhizobium TaxID=325217 RepID=UPI0033389F98
MDATDFLTDRREILPTASLTGPRTAHCGHLGGSHVTDIAGSEDLRGIMAKYSGHTDTGRDSFPTILPSLSQWQKILRDATAKSEPTECATENSVSQARWILVPLFGLWIAFAAAGAIL